MTDRLDHSFDSLRRACAASGPIAFVTLGSGMSSITDGLPVIEWCGFGDIPGLRASTVAGHRGRLSLVEWASKKVLVSEGRLHFYEGNPWDDVVRPIRFAAEVGIRLAILTNAAGGIRDDLAPGTLMPLGDQLEWNRPHPWRAPTRPSPYSQRVLDPAETAPPGVYACVTGPSYETPAEIRALRSQGADAVGMSTTREAVAGSEAGMEVVAVSLITNRAAGLSAAALHHGDVMEVGRRAAGRLGRLIGGLLAQI